MTKVRVDTARWDVAQQRLDLEAIRRQVFTDEQGVSAELEWDGRDAQAVHFLAYDAQGKAIACARLLADGQVGRMAVLKAWRGQGVGRQVMRAVLDYAQQHHYPALFLHAQTRALDFYRGFGFVAEGEEFLDAGIPHYMMHLER